MDQAKSAAGAVESRNAPKDATSATAFSSHLPQSFGLSRPCSMWTFSTSKADTAGGGLIVREGIRSPVHVGVAPSSAAISL